MLGAIAGLAGATGLSAPGAQAAPAAGEGALDPAAEARKIAFGRVGHGEKVLLISGFPQTRRSWNRVTPLLAPKFEMIPADLPSFGDSGILATSRPVTPMVHAPRRHWRRARLSGHLTRAPAARPGPLEVIAAEPAGDVHHLADEIEAPRRGRPWCASRGRGCRRRRP